MMKKIRAWLGKIEDKRSRKAAEIEKEKAEKKERLRKEWEELKSMFGK